MAEAVTHAFDAGEHLAVQAGTGTGKSLAYLVPAIARAVATDETVVVSTATIALQRQLVDRDLPALADSLAGALPRSPKFALLKGRGNYLCLNKIHNGSAAEPDDRPQEELFDAAASTALGRDVQRLTAWSSTTETGDRDELTPGVPDRSWAQVSVSARECIGAARCPFGTDCFAEKARDTAGHADVVVTNHALLAIDAISDAAVLPEHRLLVVDEAHELVDRVTSVATAELSNATLSAANRRVARLVEPELAQRLETATATFSSAIHDATPGRIDRLDDEMTTYLTSLRDAASRARSAIDMSPSDPKAASARAEAVTALTDISDTASRIVASFVPDIPDRDDVVWLDHEDNRGSIRAIMSGGTPVGGGPVAQQALRAVHGGVDLGHTDHRRELRCDGRGLGTGGQGGRETTVPRYRCRIPVRARQIRDPLRRRPSAAAGARRHRLGRAACGDRGADRCRGRPNTGTLLVDAGRAGGRRDHARAAVHSGVVPGR